EKVLRALSLWDKKDNRLMTLSGGMKRRVLIAKALSHEPSVLFLDEPSARVDVELRKGMWDVVRGLRDAGTTIILTTHYMEAAEGRAGRVACITRGGFRRVEEKPELMRRLGRKQLCIELAEPRPVVPAALGRSEPRLSDDGTTLVHEYDPKRDENAIPALLAGLAEAGIGFRDLHTEQSSLEDIFVGLVSETRKAP